MAMLHIRISGLSIKAHHFVDLVERACAEKLEQILDLIRLL
jgi:hypothetical protein